MKRLAYIDALRGYAILGVMVVHAAALVPDLSAPWRVLTNQGARGVQLFFVVSALTLMLSWHQRSDGAVPFFIRRVFRIAPMFWLAIVFFIVVEGFEPRLGAPNGIGWWHVAATAFLAHGFHPETLTSVVRGGWSVADEVIFYALFPWLVAVIRSLRASAIAIVFSVMMAAVFFFGGQAVVAHWLPEADRSDVNVLLFLAFPSQLPAFMVGIAVYHALVTYGGRVPEAWLKRGLALSIAAMLLLALVPFQIHAAYVLAFGVFAFCLSGAPIAMLVNPVIAWIGKISFSAYLWHLAFISLFGERLVFGSGMMAFATTFAILGVLTIMASSVTYLVVEKPMIRLGSRMAAAAGTVPARAPAKA